MRALLNAFVKELSVMTLMAMLSVSPMPTYALSSVTINTGGAGGLTLVSPGPVIAGLPLSLFIVQTRSEAARNTKTANTVNFKAFTATSSFYGYLHLFLYIILQILL